MVGKLEQRIKEELKLSGELMPYENTVDDDEKNILNICEEMWNEFPKLWVDNSDGKITEANTFLEILKWKEKWSGK